jgi:hypothetical protein
MVCCTCLRHDDCAVRVLLYSSVATQKNDMAWVYEL